MSASPNVRPLAGRRVLVTCAPDAARELVVRLKRLGAETTCWAPFEIVPLASDTIDQALHARDNGNWIAFTSAVAARIVAARVTLQGLQHLWSYLKVGAIGAATARTLAQVARAPDMIAHESSAADLAHSLGRLPAGTLLYPCSQQATNDLATRLREKGWVVHQIAVYSLRPAPARERSRLLSTAVDAVVFTSPSAVRIALDEWTASGAVPAQRPRFVAIGATTAAALHRARAVADAVARTPAATDTADAVLRALSRL